MSKFHKHSLTFRLIPKKSKKHFKIDQFSPLTLTLLALRYSSFFFSQTCESLSLSLSNPSVFQWPLDQSHHRSPHHKIPKETLESGPHPPSVGVVFLWLSICCGFGCGFLNLLLPVWSVVACSRFVYGFC